MQVEEILNEVKFSNYVETGECKTDIDLPDFVRCNNSLTWRSLSFILIDYLIYLTLMIKVVCIAAAEF